jgi:hypothetical protein
MNRKSSNLSIWLLQLFRKRPIFFLLFAFAGLVMGYLFTFVFPDINEAKELVFRGIGITCLIFYTGLLIMFLHKINTGTWGQFCDMTIAGIELAQAKRSGLAATSSALRGVCGGGRALLMLSFVSLLASSLFPASFYWRELRGLRGLGTLGLFIGPVILILSCWELFRYQWRLITVVAAIISFAATIVFWGTFVLYVTGRFP